MINNSDKPLVLVGSRIPLGKIKRVCAQHGIEIAGIIDSDYYGNRELLEDIPVIDSEDNLSKYKDDYNFFMATSWSPDPAHTRDNQKRKYLIELIEKNNLNCISLIDSHSVIDSTARIGKNVFIDCFCMVEEGVTFGDYSSMYNHAGIGHHSTVGKNCVLQGKSGVTSYVTIEDDCYLGICSELMRSDTVLKRGTIVHPSLVLHRSTEENEVISLIGKDLRRIYNNKQIV